MRTLLAIFLLCGGAGAFAQSAVTPEHTAAGSLALFFEAFHVKYHVYPDNWEELDEFSFERERDFVSTQLARRYELIPSRFLLTAPLEGRMLAVWRNPGYEGTKEGLRGPGRYVIYETGEGMVLWRWVDEPEIELLFAAAGQPLPAPNGEPERAEVSPLEFLRGSVLAWVLYGFISLALLYWVGKKVLQDRQKNGSRNGRASGKLMRCLFAIFLLLAGCAGSSDISDNTEARETARTLKHLLQAFHGKYGVYPTDWKQLDALSANPEAGYISRHFAKRYELVAKPFEVDAPSVEGKILALWRSPGFGVVISREGGFTYNSNVRKEKLKGPGRYVIYRAQDPPALDQDVPVAGGVQWEWVEEADIVRMFAAAGQPLPVPDGAPESEEVSRVRHNLLIGKALSGVIALLSLFWVGWAVWQERRAAWRIRTAGEKVGGTLRVMLLTWLLSCAAAGLATWCLRGVMEGWSFRTMWQNQEWFFLGVSAATGLVLIPFFFMAGMFAVSTGVSALCGEGALRRQRASLIAAVYGATVVFSLLPVAEHQNIFGAVGVLWAAIPVFATVRRVRKNKPAAECILLREFFKAKTNG